MAFVDSLIEKGILKKTEAEKVLSDVGAGSNLDEVLINHGVASDEILKLREEYFNIPSKSIDGLEVPFEVLKDVPEESALYYNFVPVGMTDGVLEIGMVDPDDTPARDAIQFIASKLNIPYKIFLISLDDFKEVVKQYKGITGEVDKALSELETELVSTGKDADVLMTPKGKGNGDISDVSKTKIIEDAPVTKIVAVILRHAIEGNASDIHIEPIGDKVRVRFRVDGTMYTSIVLPASLQSAVVARIKILTSSMKLDEKRKPQDGRFSARVEGKKVDFRVSTFPTYYGEKVVMRILDSEKGIQKLEDLGLSQENADIIRRAIKKPYGLILLTGPTGSGKTTTLYSMLNEIDRETKNVISLEEPVEYNVPGMSQSQVRPEIGYTFANGLRSILRQDPDIIMVGEIRDKETAQLAIQAALTGHLVFSTLHTNNASGVIPRLVDMGVDPFLIAPTLIVAIAQRLVKTTCEGATKAKPIDEAVRVMIEKQVADLPEEKRKQFLSAKEIYEVSPTPTCPTGLKGRSAVFEILDVDQEVEHVILTNPVEEEVYKVARKKGMITMKEDALLKAFRGEITFEQVNDLG